MLISLGLSVWEMFHHGLASPYDSGVYYDAAYQMVSGWWPYHDFAFVQPPGLLISLVPAAVVGHVISPSVGLVVARLTTALASAGVAGLTSFILRHRPGVALVSGVAVALDPLAMSVSAQVKIEPLLVLLILGSFAVVGDRDSSDLSNRRLATAGAFLGTALSVKLWALIPALAFAVVWVPLLRRRILIPLASASAVFTAVTGPFIARSPDAFIRDVGLDQVLRHGGPLVGLVTRLSRIFPIPVHSAWWPAAIVAAALLASALVLLRRGERGGVFFSLASVSSVAAVLSPPEFYAYYGYFVASFAIPAVVLAISESPVSRGSLVIWSSAALAALGITTFVDYPHQAPNATSYAAAAAERVIPAGSCTVFDIPAVAVVADRAERPSPSCPLVVDPFGMTMAESSSVAALQWRSIFSRSEYVTLGPVRTSSVTWTPTLERWFTHHFRRILDEPGLVYVYRIR
jgi:hypothetical protein